MSLAFAFLLVVLALGVTVIGMMGIGWIVGRLINVLFRPNSWSIFSADDNWEYMVSGLVAILCLCGITLIGLGLLQLAILVMTIFGG